MSVLLDISNGYGLVLAAATSTFFVNTLHVIRTSSLRKVSGVKYPNAYASAEQADKNRDAHAFNCAQRAHANFTENHASLLGALFISGLRFPITAAILGAGWSFSRLLYLYGYTSEAGPPGRRVGAIAASLSDFTLKVIAAFTCVQVIAGR